MRFKATFDGREFLVNTGRDGKSLYVDGQEYPVSLDRKAPGRCVVALGDRTFDLRIREDEAGTFLIELAGERIIAQVTETTREAGRPAPPHRATEPVTTVGPPKRVAEVAGDGLLAPMPGKVLALFVEVGDEVDTGDVVLILEAMKMENELRSPGKARVTAVNVKPGDSVTADQLLIALD